MTQIAPNPYRDAGVDTERGDQLAEWLADSQSKAFIHPLGLGRIKSGIGGFAGVFDLDLKQFEKPQLVASTDGVGTKLLLGLDSHRIATLGQDLVGMCVNDLYTVGAQPLFFLDYYATGKLSTDQFKVVLSSIQDSCRKCSMALMGGETAEMPGLYQKGHFDLAGFVVGAVDDKKRLGPEKTKIGDVLIGWESSGFHSNGFSLIRKWLKEFPHLNSPQILDRLMEPTRLYPEILDAMSVLGGDLHAAAHITGGGVSGNLPRVLRENQAATLRLSALNTPGWMRDFIESSKETLPNVEPVFNLGIGMILVVANDKAQHLIDFSKKCGLGGHVLGNVVEHAGESVVQYID